MLHRASAVVLLLCAACAPAIAPLPPDAGPALTRAEALQRECRRADDAMQCTSEGLLHVLRENGVTEAMETLDALAGRDAEVRRDGHMYAHAIGLSADTTPESVEETFRDCTPAFQSGCFHGVIQSYFAHRVGTGAAVDSASVDGLCADYRGPDDRWLLFQCVHGIGHGLTMLNGYHLPTALEGCDLLSSEWDREGCYGGVFMESVVNATTPHHAVGRPDAGEHAHHHGGHVAAASQPREPFPALDPADPLYPCSRVADRYLQACYQMQTSAILFHNGGDLAATARTCDGAPELYRNVCYVSLGRDISARTQQDHAAARKACSAGDARYRSWCHIGYVKNLVDLTADPRDALRYCREAADAELKVACYHAVGEEIWVLTADPQRGESWCALAEPGYQNDCRRGAGLARATSPPRRP